MNGHRTAAKAASTGTQCVTLGYHRRENGTTMPSDILSTAVKSRKRKAAEAQLASRFTEAPSPQEQSTLTADLAPLDVMHTTSLPACRHAACTAGFPQTATAGQPHGPRWCSDPVSVQRMDWDAVTQALDACFLPGYESVINKRLACGNIQVMVVDEHDKLIEGLDMLERSMTDSYIGIDLEWRPEWRKVAPPSKVALMQLATANCMLLIRTVNMVHNMPLCLRTFLRRHTFVAFSWDGADDQKMRASFGGSRELFGSLLDLRVLFEELGLGVGRGLKSVAKSLLGYELRKAKSVICSNWAADTLKPAQLKYAALDAFITAHAFRELRRQHARSDTCSSCGQAHGAAVPAPYVVGHAEGALDSSAKVQVSNQQGEGDRGNMDAAAVKQHEAGARFSGPASGVSGTMTTGAAQADSHNQAGVLSHDVMLGNVAGLDWLPTSCAGRGASLKPPERPVLELKVKCPFPGCGRVFEAHKLALWRSHVAGKHEGERKVVCRVCGRLRGTGVWVVTSQREQQEREVAAPASHRQKRVRHSHTEEAASAAQAATGGEVNCSAHRRLELHGLPPTWDGRAVGHCAVQAQSISHRKGAPRPGSSSSLVSEQGAVHLL